MRSEIVGACDSLQQNEPVPVDIRYTFEEAVGDTAGGQDYETLC